MSKYNYLGNVLGEVQPDAMPRDWYSDSYTVSTKGEKKGSVWEVIEKGKTFYTVSAGVTKQVRNSRRNGFSFSFKEHYILTEKGWDEIQAIIVEKELSTLAEA